MASDERDLGTHHHVGPRPTHTTKTQDSGNSTSPNQAHHCANLTHRNAERKLTTGKRTRRQAHLVKASQSRLSVGIRIPRVSLPIARHTRHQPSRRTQARPVSKSNGINARLRPRSQTQPDKMSSERMWKLSRTRCCSHNTALALYASGERRPYVFPQRQSSDLLSLIAEILITCSGGSRNEAMTPQNTSFARRGKSRQYMPHPRDCTTWLRAGDTTCRPASMGSEGRQQEALITYSQRPVLCILFCHPRLRLSCTDQLASRRKRLGHPPSVRTHLRIQDMQCDEYGLKQKTHLPALSRGLSAGATVSDRCFQRAFDASWGNP